MYVLILLLICIEFNHNNIQYKCYSIPKYYIYDFIWTRSFIFTIGFFFFSRKR